MHKRILLLLQNASMMTLATPVLRALNEQYHITVYIPPVRGQDIATRHPALDNVCVTDEESILLLNMHRFGLVLTTLAIPCNFHMHLAGRLLEAAHACGIKVLELQHGLFQWGHLFVDEKPVLCAAELAGVDRGLGECINVHDAYLPWFGEGAIGYPLSDVAAPQNTSPKGVLIATNLHWNIYSISEQKRFCKAVIAAAEAQPNTPFLWKPHPNDYTMVRNWLRASTPSNLSITPRDEKRSFEELAQAHAAAISMPSTVLLSLEAMRIPVALFSCEGNATLVSHFANSHRFHDTESLMSLMADDAFGTPATSGFLQPFNPDALHSAITAHFRQTPASPFPNLAIWNAIQQEKQSRFSARLRRSLLPLYRKLAQWPLLADILHHPGVRRFLRAAATR